MARKNVLNAADIRAWMQEEFVTYATDTRNAKHLSMRLRLAEAVAVVTHGEEVIYEGPNLDAATEAFNDAW